MLKRISFIILPIIALFVFGMAIQPARAGTVYVEYNGPRYDPDGYSDRIASEYRRGYQVDDWLERGDSSVTDSPLYEDGIRLAAWASQNGEDFSYALASAIYFFEVPRNARSIRIKISYDGEGDRFDNENEVAGRIWIRRSQPAEGYTEYYPDEGRYEDFEKPLYGDTFTLRARKNYEIIRISANDHVTNDTMELHVVAEGGQRIDVKYIEVETYSYLPSVRVVTRYYSDYTWRPWNNYAYWYFYTGPMYSFSDYYYIRYTYPNYHVHYVDIRKRYNQYLTVYYRSYPNRHYVGWGHVNYVRGNSRRGWDRSSLGRWTREHDQARKVYTSVSRSPARTRSSDIQKSRASFRSVLSTRSGLSPAEVRAGTVRSKTTTTTTRQSTSVRTNRGVETRANSSADVRSRTTVPEARRDVGSRSSVESSRIQRSNQQNSGSRAPERSSVQTRTQTETKVRRETERPSTSSSRSSTPSQTRSRIEVKRNTSSSQSSSKQQNPSSDTQTRVRRESSRSSTPQKKESETKKVETRVQSRSQTPNRAPSKVESSKSKDDDDDEDKNKSNSSSSSSSTRVRRETRR